MAYQQPTPGGDVLQVWTKGRVIPLSAGVCGLVLLVAVIVAFRHDPRAFIGLDVIALAVFAFGVAIAFRRKLTLTRDTVIVRKLFVTRHLPLREVANVWAHRDPRRNLLLSMIIDIPTVVITMSDRKSVNTMSLGAAPGYRHGIVAIAEAAKAAGSPIDI
jgi:hypothetical protein